MADDLDDPAAADLAGPGTGRGTLPGGLGAALPASDTWQVVVEPGPPHRQRVEESWFCVADGVVGTRGSLEEDGPGSVPMVLAAGVYDGTQALLPVASWVGLDAPPPETPGRRVLDLRDGTLLRVAPTPEGEQRSLRFASLADPGVGVLVAVRPHRAPPPEGQHGRAGPPGGPPGGLLGAPSGDGAAGGRPAADVDHTSQLRSSDLGGGVLVVTRTDHLATTAGTEVVERVAVHAVGVSRLPSAAVARRRLHRQTGRGVTALLADQRRAWAARWRHAEVSIAGDRDLTRAVRFGLFHLMASVGTGAEAAVGARGLSGTAYDGHVFWDADAFVLPFLAATHPPAARAMLAYRLHRLPAARAAAAALGRAGARFPWESAADGTDVTPRTGEDAAGHQVPILTGLLEEHVTADVAWAAWRLAAWTGDWRYLDGPARPLLVDTARYWASRLRLDAAGAAHIDAVIGPDEYHEDVDDNAFTNRMAAWNLRRAAELVCRRPGPGQCHEADRWRDLADRVVTGTDPVSGVTEQFAGYHRLEPVMAASVGTVPFAGDLVLGRRRLTASQLTKQADVLMIHHMIPEAADPAALGADLDHYLPRCCHGSSLSPAIHAAVAARAGRTDEARHLLDLATRIDLADMTGSTAGGLHLAAFGGVWQALVHGFAGVQVTGPGDAALVVDPRVPDEWGELRLRLTWHRRHLVLRCRPDALYVGTDRALAVVVRGEPARVVPPGRWFP